MLSGPGVKNIFEFFTSPGPFHIESAQPGGDTLPAEISKAAVESGDPAAIASVEMFAELLGAEAGNLALKTLATGGVYIGGGIAGYLLKFLKHRRLRDAFVNKGPKSIQTLLSRMPIHVVTSNDGRYSAPHITRNDL